MYSKIHKYSPFLYNVFTIPWLWNFSIRNYRLFNQWSYVLHQIL